jgi:transcriptional regulator of heat shock response
LSPVNVADSVQLSSEVIASENDKTRQELQETFTNMLDPWLVTLLDNNLSHLKNEMGTSRETQQQQYKDIISKIQKHIQPLHSEMAASCEIIEGQCREILAKLQEQDERLAGVIESINPNKRSLRLQTTAKTTTIKMARTSNNL